MAYVHGKVHCLAYSNNSTRTTWSQSSQPLSFKNLHSLKNIYTVFCSIHITAVFKKINISALAAYLAHSHTTMLIKCHKKLTCNTFFASTNVLTVKAKMNRLDNSRELARTHSVIQTAAHLTNRRKTQKNLFWGASITCEVQRVIRCLKAGCAAFAKLC